MRHYNGRQVRTQGVSDPFAVHEWMESGYKDPWRGTSQWRAVAERESPRKSLFGRPILVGKPQFHSVSVLPASEDDA